MRGQLPSPRRALRHYARAAEETVSKGHREELSSAIGKPHAFTSCPAPWPSSTLLANSCCDCAAVAKLATGRLADSRTDLKRLWLATTSARATTTSVHGSGAVAAPEECAASTPLAVAPHSCRSSAVNAAHGSICPRQPARRAELRNTFHDSKRVKWPEQEIATEIR